MARCNACNGSKKVMGLGTIQTKTCPTCNGSGIDPDSRGYELKRKNQEEIINEEETKKCLYQ